MTIANRMTATDFFSYVAAALQGIPPHPTDFSVLARIAQLGNIPGQPFDAARFTDTELSEIQEGATAALEEMVAAIPTIGTEANGWTNFSNTGVYGNSYLAGPASPSLGSAPPARRRDLPAPRPRCRRRPVVGDQNYILHSTPTPCRPLRRSGPSRCRTRRDSRQRMSSTGSRPATGTRCTTTTTDPWTSTSSTATPARTRKPTGCPHRWVHSASTCVCTHPHPRRSTAAGAYPWCTRPDARGRPAGRAALDTPAGRPNWVVTNTFPAAQPTSTWINQMCLVCLSTRCRRSSTVGYGMRMARTPWPHDRIMVGAP